MTVCSMVNLVSMEDEVNSIIKAHKYDIERNKVKQFSPYKETISLYVTKNDCELRKNGQCPVFNRLQYGACAELLRELERNGFTQKEGELPDIAYNKEQNYYTVNDGQHRVCIASILKMDIMIRKEIPDAIGDIRDTSSIIVDKGIPRKNPFCHDPY